MKFILFCLVAMNGIFASTKPSLKRRREDEAAAAVLRPLRWAESNNGTAPSGRLIQVYRAPLVHAFYGQSLAKVLPALIQSDIANDRFVPNLTLNSEVAPFGRFELGDRIAERMESVVYTVKGRPDLLIKYRANCQEIRLQEFLAPINPYIHPAIAEFFYTRKASEFGLAPKMHYVSPPVRLSPNQMGKCGFTIERADYKSCASAENSSVRYLVMNRVQGMRLQVFVKKFPKERVPFAMGMGLGAELMRMFEELHMKAGIVHGDIDTETIMINPDTLKLTLIDFSRAFDHYTNRTRAPIRSSLGTKVRRQSPWELQGYKSSARDDVARAVGMIAELINGRDHYFFTNSLLFENPNVAVSLEWKSKANIFVTPRKVFKQVNSTIEYFDPVDGLTIADAAKTEIRRELANILTLVRSMVDINGPVPYTEIRAAFAKCQDLANL
jgi:hypothetical protein